MKKTIEELIRAGHTKAYATSEALQLYNGKIDSKAPEIKDFLKAASSCGEHNAIERMNYAIDNNDLIPEEARLYIDNLYKLNKSAAKRVIYNHIHAAPGNYKRNTIYNEAHYKLADLAMEGVKDRIEAAAEGFPADVYNSIKKVYLTQIDHILTVAAKSTVENAYWKTLSGKIDEYLLKK